MQAQRKADSDGQIPHIHPHPGGKGVSAARKYQIQVCNRQRPAAQKEKIPFIHHRSGGGGVTSARKSIPKMTTGTLTHKGERWYPWFNALSERLYRTYILCRDWTCIHSDTVLGFAGGATPTGIFLDPPYKLANRDPGLYANDHTDDALPDAVHDWALKMGEDERIRIAYACLEGDYEMPDTWEKFVWKNSRNGGEVIWFSPHCKEVGQIELFGE